LTESPISNCVLGAEDYDAVRALWEAAGLHIRPVGRDSREEFAAQIASGCEVVLGLKDGGRLVGVVLATSDSRRGWINRLAIHPDYRRRGLGLRLIAACEHLLRDERGLHVISAHIEDWNTASIALFTKAGYLHHPDIFYFAKRESQDV
jgi:RimJ/RimL family protein N-acetyltransferase